MEPKIAAILDTNVLFEIFSCHDVMNKCDEVLNRGGEPGGRDLAYRRERARAAVLLALAFNEQCTATYSLHTEPMAIAERVKDHTDAPYAAVFLEFVAKRLLHRWHAMFPEAEDHVRSNAADERLVAKASEFRCPLITDEGNTAAGICHKGLRKRAADAGVPVYTPREFFKAFYSHMDEAALVQDFLDRFRMEVPAFLDAHQDSETSRTP